MENSGNLFEDVQAMSEFIRRDEEKIKREAAAELEARIASRDQEISELRRCVGYLIKREKSKHATIAALRRWNETYKRDLKAIGFSLYLTEERLKRVSATPTQPELSLVMAANNGK